MNALDRLRALHAAATQGKWTAMALWSQQVKGR